jgi:universal stress protein A
MKVKKILVPVDFSKGQTHALSLATSLARDSGAKLFIAHVEEPTLAYTPGGAYYGVPSPQQEDLVHMLHEIVPPSEDVEYEHQSLQGQPSEAIIAFAEEINADLIVMSTHGRTGISRVLMGSVAEAVVRHAPCPVITIKESAREAIETTG